KGSLNYQLKSDCYMLSSVKRREKFGTHHYVYHMVPEVLFSMLKSSTVKMETNCHQVLISSSVLISFRSVKSLKEIKWRDVTVIKGLFRKYSQTKICRLCQMAHQLILCLTR